jgi:tRNA nucleotidyltransferase/poly(A) polymerase
MTEPVPVDERSAARQFAVEVVQTLRAAGYEALWAGGCVRDWLLGKIPKDYDVATSAHPDQIRDLFGRRRTLAIGASFGVITVLGPRGAGQIEVATFRRDGGYSDGRHPDGVSFSTAAEDAQRRDFTINGIFFDPLEERVIDYVGGVEDLERKVVRAIGDPLARISEDKLRMLRAVRFAATFDFELEAATMAAIQQQAHEIVIVSAERIAAEMRRMLVHPGRATALRLLVESQLLDVILPEARLLDPASDAGPNETRGAAYERARSILARLEAPHFATALAALLRELQVADAPPIAQVVGSRWRLSNEERGLATWLLAHEALARHAHLHSWSRVQRMLIQPGAEELVQLGRAIAETLGESTAGIDYCAAKLRLPREELNPAPLITGNDLRTAGLQPGPKFRLLLESIRDAQLLGEITTKDEALHLARRLLT